MAHLSWVWRIINALSKTKKKKKKKEKKKVMYMGIFQEKEDVYLCSYKEMTNCFKLFSGKPHMETFSDGLISYINFL